MVTLDSAPLAHPGVDTDEFLIVCCGCKRLRVGPMEFVVMNPYELWEKRESISHTLCPECANLYYGFSRNHYAKIVRKET